ncbi:MULTISPECIES: phosphotransferase family protein [unclassified Pseudonocardia]|uniref:phosphotransferase family protein n=1 Tax=unclassified Pseudonocardia TaxID=2619320 RepID=UPI000959FDEB|nr:MULTISPECIES: phosphotransferase family protein [unclassified Pseudonocardia]MBN9098686.1 phosphotransferase family protein [Pseudonocardia sp.]OJY52075.1 MAG: phosphotransferase family protein [Pseudonocardia sp. 73-21]
MSSAVSRPEGSQPEWLAADLVDLDAVHRWGIAAGLPDAPIQDVRRIGGGTQNVVLWMSWGDRNLVLRRPPEHPRPGSNAALRREMRVLAALAGTDVPHPRLVAGCDDEDVQGGAVFYLMDAVEGSNPGDELGEPYLGSAEARHTGALDTAGALARLAAVDHRAVGLGDLGRPEGFLTRQVPRWLDHLASYERLPGYPGPTLPHVDELAAWLTAHQPADTRPGIVHGDYHLNNVLLAHDTPRVAAIVDWEMCTIGDPLLDLGWLLVTWPDDGWEPVTGGPLAALGDLPDRDELVTHYASHSDRDLTDIDWYTALAGLKLAVVIEGTHARALAGKADRDTGLRLHTAAIGLLNRAAEITGL